MYTILAHLPHDCTAWCQCDTLEDLVAYLEEWLPMSHKVECRETGEEIECA